MLVFFVLLQFVVQLSAQEVHPVSITFSEKLSAPRTLHSAQPKIQGTGVSSDLLRIEYFLSQSDFKSCADLAKKLRSRAKGLEVWLSLKELHCRNAHLTAKNDGLSRVEDLLAEIQGSPEWFLNFPGAKQVQDIFIYSSLNILPLQMKLKRNTAWKNIMDEQRSSG
jgi:hypothetical protein